MSERAVRRLGWAATATALAMYLSYVDIILRNLAGQPGSIVLPAATTLNATLWFGYGLLGAKRDWPIMVANAPGIALGATALVTAL